MTSPTPRARGTRRPRRAHRGWPRRGARRAGITIVELVVAILVLTTGLLALATTGTVVVRQMRHGTLQTVAAAMVQSRFDSLAGINCANLPLTASGTHQARGVRERWAMHDGDNVRFLFDTVTFEGRPRPLVYQSIIPCRNVVVTP